VHLVGISHCAPCTGRLARDVILATRPDAVVLEVDEVRCLRTSLDGIGVACGQDGAQYCHVLFSRRGWSGYSCSFEAYSMAFFTLKTFNRLRWCSGRRSGACRQPAFHLPMAVPFAVPSGCISG
jgi:hypothetical protein